MDQSPLPFIHLMGVLKHLPRTGWLRSNPHPESVASHSFRLALMGLFAPSPLDRYRCMYIGLCHDLAEAVVGDIPTFAGVPKDHKRNLECLAFQYIEELVKPYNPEVAKEIVSAWTEYEEGKTAEAQWVKEMDKLECLIQAFEYEKTEGFDKNVLGEFQSLSSKITSAEGTQWLCILQNERTLHFSKRERCFPVIFMVGGRAASIYRCNSLPIEGVRYVSMRSVIHEKASDPSYRLAKLISNYLANKLDIPTQLKVQLLEQKLKAVVANREDGTWVLVDGFPDSKEDLLVFQANVQHKNFILLLGQCGDEGTADGNEDVWKAGTRKDLEDHCLALHKGSTIAVDIDGSKEMVRARIVQAVTEIIDRAANQDYKENQ